MSPVCGYCGAAFGKPLDAEDHGLDGHPWVPGGEDVIYWEGDPGVLEYLLLRRSGS